MDVREGVEGKVGLASGAEDHSILCGDCRELVPTLGKFDLVFGDQPFNINQKYVGYNDNLKQDVFDKFWGRVSGTNAERWKHSPNQLPEVYLRRIILAYSNPGDRVLDPYCGSGTTITVAKALGRKCVTIDISPESVESAKQRLIRGAVRV